MNAKIEKNQQNQDLTEMRAYIERVQADYTDAYIDRTEQIDKQKADKNNSEKQKIDIQPPMLIAATVGAGKSHAITKRIKKAQEAGLPTLTLVHTKKLALEYLERYMTAGVDAVMYKPREAPAEDGTTTAHTCFKINEVNEAGEKHHRPAQSVCRECEHGMRVGFESANEKRKETAIRFFAKKQMSETQIFEISACRFLYEGLPDQLRQPHIIATHAAFSDALAFLEDQIGDAKRLTQRLIIVDEAFALTESVEINPHAVETWLKSIDGTMEAIARGFFKDSAAAEEKIKEALTLAKKALKDTMNVLINDAPIKDLKDIVSASIKALNDADLTTGGTAIFEKITSNQASEFFIPLRALNALNAALKTNTARLSQERTIHVEANTPLLNHIIKKGSTILLDATPSETIRQAVKMADGQIIDAHIKQNISVKHYSQKMFTRGNPKKEGYRYTAERAIADGYAACQQFKRPNVDISFITHKAYFQHAIPLKEAKETAELFTLKTGVKAGWFGAHDRGHNDYEGNDLVIAGITILDYKAIATLWHKHAVVMMQLGVEVNFNLSGKNPDYTYYVPTDKAQRDFLLEYYASNIVQAIGRARGISAQETLKIHLLGGVSQVFKYLEKYKIEVQRGGVFTAATRKNSPINDIINTAAILIKQGFELYKITVDQLQAACQAGLSKLKHRREIVVRVLRELKTHGFAFFKARIKRPPRLRLRPAPAPAPKPAHSATSAAMPKPFNPEWMFEPGIDEALLSTL